MALFLLCPNLGWIQGQFNFTEDSLRYPTPLIRSPFSGDPGRFPKRGSRHTIMLKDRIVSGLHTTNRRFPDDLTGGTPSEQTTSIAQPPSSRSRRILRTPRRHPREDTPPGNRERGQLLHDSSDPDAYRQNPDRHATSPGGFVMKNHYKTYKTNLRPRCTVHSDLMGLGFPGDGSSVRNMNCMITEILE